jgi:peptidoglycan/xylan/chitin deacetylase (PgdA/CDA1 family)
MRTLEQLHRRRADQRRRRRRQGRVLASAVVLSCLAILAALTGGGRHRPRPPAGPPQARAAVPPRRAAAPRMTVARREQAAIAREEQRLPFVSSGGRRRREIALTFDDGPGPYTLDVVRVLNRMRAPATFFQVGFMIPDFPLAQRALLAQPRFVLGDHTESHANLSRLPAAAQVRQLRDEAGMQHLHGAPWPRLFRPPYGMFDAATEQTLRRLHLLMVLWSIDSRDYTRPGVDRIVQRVLAGARPGAIVLMHDAGGTRVQTVRALPRIIRGLRARHFRLVTVPRLLLDDPPPSRQTRPATGVG